MICLKLVHVQAGFSVAFVYEPLLRDEDETRVNAGQVITVTKYMK